MAQLRHPLRYNIWDGGAAVGRMGGVCGAAGGFVVPAGAAVWGDGGALQEGNCLGNLKVIYVGQRLYVPGLGVTVTVEATRPVEE